MDTKKKYRFEFEAETSSELLEYPHTIREHMQFFERFYITLDALPQLEFNVGRNTMHWKAHAFLMTDDVSEVNSLLEIAKVHKLTVRAQQSSTFMYDGKYYVDTHVGTEDFEIWKNIARSWDYTYIYSDDRTTYIRGLECEKAVFSCVSDRYLMWYNWILGRQIPNHTGCSTFGRRLITGGFGTQKNAMIMFGFVVE
jgi:hypothetical protein